MRTTSMGIKMMTRSCIFAGLALFFAAGAVAEERPPNFIVIYCDNLGYGDIQPFGSQLHRTPNLNRMAEEGRKFNHFCVTAGVCTPSRASLMTGCYAQRIGMHVNDRDGWVLRPVSPYGLNPNEWTIAESLKKQGYATGMVGKWHLGDQTEFLPTRQGFDWFYGVPYSDDMTERRWTDGSQWPPLPLMENERVVEAPCDRNGLTKRYTQRALQWIESNKENPFFLYFPQAMPGSTKSPFASPEFQGQSKNGPWGDAIEELDWSLGQVLQKLRELELDRQTLVIWTSDNGAPINSDPKDLSRGSNLPLHGRGYTTAEGAFRVPMIVWQPGVVPAGSECDELCTTMDLLPTLTRLAGGAIESSRKIDGHDIAPLLFGQRDAKSPYRAFYYYDRDQLQAVRKGPWKLFLPVQPIARHPHFSMTVSPRPLLFHVVDDVACQQNVAAQHDSIVSELMELAEAAREELGDVDRTGRGQREPGRIPVGATPQPQILPENPLSNLEAEKGGRHWVQADTPPPLPPAESFKTLQIEDGFEVTLFAAEPLVQDPVAIAFDREGRMFVSEYGDYPTGPEEDGAEPLSRIVMLEDEDQDGKADRRHVFADGLNFAHSMMPFRGGLLVGAQTEILFLKDNDGDHQADERKVLFQGFQPAHPQMQIGNPRWGIDNWIYWNYGPGDVSEAGHPGGQRRLPRKEFRFDPRTMAFESGSGMGQFGNTVDRWGRRYYCTNRNPIITTSLMPEILARNPYHTVAKPYYDVGKAGGETQVFPLVEMKSNWLSHAGTHTSACGTTAYNGDLGDEGFQRSLFVCEPIGHLVTRSILRQDGLRLVADRAEEAQDFLASTDAWFRPASLATGPGGALYLADMYRLWVEHPKFLPPEIAARLDWRAGSDRGRIYRIVPSGSEPSDYKPPQSVSEIVALLDDPNAWRQTLAQRLLVEDQELAATDRLRGLLQSRRATTRLRALWTLEGLATLHPQDVLRGLGDDAQAVRAASVQLASRWIDRPEVLSAVLHAANDEDVSVRFEVALALSLSQHQDATQALCRLAVQDGLDPMFAQGLLTSTKDRSGVLIESLVHHSGFQQQASPEASSLLRQLATIVGARGDTGEIQRVLLAFESNPSRWTSLAVISGLADGLPRYRGKLGRLTLNGLIQNPPKSLSQCSAVLRQALAECGEIAAQEDCPDVERLAAIRLLSHDDFDTASLVFRKLLLPQQPKVIQQGCLRALTQSGAPEAAGIVLSEFARFGPDLRAEALEYLLRRTDSTKTLLAAIGRQELRPSLLSVDQRIRLLKHRDEQVRQTAVEIFGSVNRNRAAVVRDYQTVLRLVGERSRGEKVFAKNCAACHRVEGKGHRVGPDLSDVTTRSKAALLYDILSPNAKVEPRFNAYSVLTVDDQVFTGLIASETPNTIVLSMTEGKQHTVGRAEIEQLKATDVSFMPEGLEKEINHQQMADLLAFLKDR